MCKFLSRFFRGKQDQIKSLVFLYNLKKLNALVNDLILQKGYLPPSTELLLAALLPVLDFLNPMVLSQMGTALEMERHEFDDFPKLIQAKEKY